MHINAPRVKIGTLVEDCRCDGLDYSGSSSRGGVGRGECEEENDMAAPHIGKYVNKDMARFDDAGVRLTAPQ